MPSAVPAAGRNSEPFGSVDCAAPRLATPSPTAQPKASAVRTERGAVTMTVKTMAGWRRYVKFPLAKASRRAASSDFPRREHQRAAVDVGLLLDVKIAEAEVL